METLHSSVFTTSEAVQYATEQLPDNPFTSRYIATKKLVLGRATFAYTDYAFTAGTSENDKRLWLQNTLRAELLEYAQAPLIPGTSWGLPYIEQLSVAESVLTMAIEKIKDALGDKFSAIVPQGQEELMATKYLSKLIRERRNFYHLSEMALEVDFLAFASTYEVK